MAAEDLFRNGQHAADVYDVHFALPAVRIFAGFFITSLQERHDAAITVSFDSQSNRAISFVYHDFSMFDVIFFIILIQPMLAIVHTLILLFKRQLN
jgi:hypothetical protein